jgi:hypothetical protein
MHILNDSVAIKNVKFSGATTKISAGSKGKAVSVGGAFSDYTCLPESLVPFFSMRN